MQQTDPMQHCKAKAKTTGKQCGNPPMTGGVVCRMHGGAAPQVREASHRNFLNRLIRPALEKLEQMLDDDDISATVTAAMIRDILDRGGLKATEKLEITSVGALEAELERLQRGGYLD